MIRPYLIVTALALGCAMPALAQEDWGPAPEKPNPPAVATPGPEVAPEPAPAAPEGALPLDVDKVPGGLGAASAPLAPATGEADVDAQVAACDRAAAHPDNPSNPPGVAGVAFAEIDVRAAIEACTTAVEAFPDVARLQYNLGRAYDAARDYAAAEAAYRRAAALGEPRAQYGLGMLYQDPASGLGRTDAEAIAPFRAAAEAGVVDAMFELGWAYENGLGIAQDYAEAARWYQQAAAGGDLMATNNLGWLYSEGLGVAQDEALAVELYRRAADGGVPLAMANLAWMLENGIGTKQDLRGAATWYRAAAMQGESQAMLGLGALYLWGDGVERDPARALEWYGRAREAGNPEAQTYIGEVYEVAQEYYDPERAADLYIEGLRAGDDWPAGRLADEWDRTTALVLQKRLAALGVYDGPIDGVIGAGTRAAMEKLLPAEE